MNFVWTPFTLILTVVVLIAAAVCCWISWRRSGYLRSMLWLEILRFVLITIVLITLNQPEFTQEIKPQEQPTLVVLHDTSGSMQTQDVMNPQAPAEKPRKRTDAVSSQRAATKSGALMAVDCTAWHEASAGPANDRTGFGDHALPPQDSLRKVCTTTHGTSEYPAKST